MNISASAIDSWYEGASQNKRRQPCKKATTALPNNQLQGHGARRRSATGSQMVELACGLVLLLLVVLVLLDFGIIGYAVYSNNNICLAAAQAAASGPPSVISRGAPEKRAEVVLAGYSTASGGIHIRPQCTVTETLVPPLPQPPLGGAVVGQVTVETIVDVHLPFGLKPVASDYSFKATRTYPYTYTMPASTNEDTKPGGVFKLPQ